MPEKNFSWEWLIRLFKTLSVLLSYDPRAFTGPQAFNYSNPWYDKTHTFNIENPVGKKISELIISYVLSIQDVPDKYYPTQFDIEYLKKRLEAQGLNSSLSSKEEIIFKIYAPICNYIFSREFMNLIINQSELLGTKLHPAETGRIIYIIFVNKFFNNKLAERYARSRIYKLIPDQYFQIFPEDAEEN